MKKYVCEVHSQIRTDVGLRSWLRSRYLVLAAVLLPLSIVFGNTVYTYDWVSTDGNPNGISATIQFMYPNSSLVPASSPTEGVEGLTINVPGFGNFYYTPLDGSLSDPVWSPKGIQSLYFTTDDPYGATFTQNSIDEINPIPSFRDYSDAGTWVLNTPDATNTVVIFMASLVALWLFNRWKLGEAREY